MLQIECLYTRLPHESADVFKDQKKVCEAWATKVGGRIVKENTEIASRTTAMIDRTAIQDILADLAMNSFDVLLVACADRLVGSERDIAALLQLLEQHGKIFCAADEQDAKTDAAESENNNHGKEGRG